MSIARIKLGAILVGWIVSFFMLLIFAAGAVAVLLSLHPDITTLFDNRGEYNTFAVNFALFAMVFISFFAGGYVAGRMSALAGAFNGTLVVITGLLVLFFVATFAVIVGNNIGIDVAGSILATLNSIATSLAILILFAVAGGALGGKFGEGYFSRLDLALAHQVQMAKARAKTEQKRGGKKQNVSPAQQRPDAKQKDLEEAKQAG